MDREWRTTNSQCRRVRETPKKSSHHFVRYAALLVFVLCVTIVVCIVLLNRKPDTPDDPIVCSPGMSGANCDSSSFIGTYPWSGSTFYTLADGGKYQKGVAFRVYAPGATQVHVLASEAGGVEIEYLMA